jgi:hypothetical protein
MKVTKPYHSATVQTSVELVGRCPVASLSVCPVCNVPFVMLSSIHKNCGLSHKEGAIVRRQFCPGGHGNVS